MSTEQTRTMFVRRSAGGETRPTLRYEIVGGPDAGKSGQLSVASATVGRAEAADIVIADPMASQFHAELAPGGDGIYVRDLGSKNGTRVDRVIIKEALVDYGAVLSVGGSSIRLTRVGDVRLDRSSATSFGAMLGSSPVMRELYPMLERLATTKLSVLIEGESGTGKEVLARALHERGGRPNAPFVTIDCTAIPVTLAESILFGHERGAFTGAHEKRVGLFEAASGGTLFIDEIGELSMDVQPKLLRVLERREVIPLGSSQPRPVDVRVLSATLRDLRTRVNHGAFREDLFFRLAQAHVYLPSLAERREDLKPLVHHFLASIPWDVEAARAIADDALEVLASRTYRGNVRELKTMVERLALLALGPVIGCEDLAFDRMLARERRVRPKALENEPSADSVDIEPFKDAKRTAIDEFERGYLARLLAKAGTNVSKAASLAGIERATLRDILKRHGQGGTD